MAKLNDHKSRAHALLSASSSERWLRCPASAKLAALYPSQDTAYTREGTLAHEVAELAASHAGMTHEHWGAIPADVDPDMIRHAENYAAYVESLCGPNTTKLLEVRVDFSAWVPEGFGTADCILLHPGGIMDVIDYKYGQGVEVSAKENSQMQLYGLGALNDYGFVYDVETVRLHIFQPRKDNISVWSLTAAELRSFGDYVANGADMALSDEPEMCAGSHCKFCPHAGRCPELTFTCLRAVRSPDTIAPDPRYLTPDDVSIILKMEPMVSTWLKKVKEQATTDLLNGKAIPGYKVVEGKQGNRKWTDELEVAKALDAAGIAKEDYTTLQLLSPAAMDKALGKKRAAELVGALIDRAPGAPTVVPESDKRQKLDRLAQAQDDFKEE